MKTQVIQLEPHDDLVSIRDKMEWTQAPRILLLWPHGKEVALGPLDLALLRRHALALGAELGLVAQSGEVRRAARKLALPVFDTSAEAQRSPWFVRTPPRPVRPQRRGELRTLLADARQSDPFEAATPAARLGAFAAGVMSVVILLALFLPSAEITLDPTRHTQSITLPVNAAPDVAAVYLSGTLPAHPIPATVQASGTTKTTGAIQSPDKPAQGIIRFSNIGDQAVSIPAGTVVRTLTQPAVRFATQSVAQVAAGSGQTAQVPIVALDFGTAGNLKAGTIQGIEGSLGLSVAASNPDPTNGGVDRSSPAPGTDDRARLRDQVLADLQREALTAMRAQLRPNDVLLPETITLSRTLVESYAPASDAQPASELGLTMQAEFQASFASADDLAYLARSALDAALPPGFEADSDSLKLAPVDALLTGADGSTRLQLRADRTVRARIDPAEVTRLAEGHLVGTAGERLAAAFVLARVPQIAMSPSWWPWLPLVPFRISVQ